MPKLDWTSEDEPEEDKIEAFKPTSFSEGTKINGEKAPGGVKPKGKGQIEQFKISDPIINEFINWVRTLDPDQYPRQAQQIRQNIGKNFRPSHLGAVIELFRMWLEATGT